MLKTKSPEIKKRIPAIGGRLNRRSRTQDSNVAKLSILENNSQPQSLTPLIRGLRTQIARVTDFMDRVPLTREDELLFISQLHSLNVLRDKFELMRAGTSKDDLAKISSHLGKKMQSSFSD